LKVVIDSSAWIEFCVAGPLADRYATYLTPATQIVTPTVVLYEVYKKIKRERGEEAALVIAARLAATEVVPFTQAIALLAADLSIAHGLAMADAIVYATARDQAAQLVTGDADMKALPGVVYIH
jgi:toxin FitB